MSQKYRLITRSDLDGIVCASLMKELDMVSEITFAHPKDIQDGKLDITEKDILTNLPYHPKAHMVFDHHASELVRNRQPAANLVNDPTAPSAAQVVYRHFGGMIKFSNISQEVIEATNKVDSGQIKKEDILNPQGWTLLGFLMDSRTGLGRFHNFRISNYQLMMELVELFRKEKSIDDILKHPDVAERVKMYHEHTELARKQITSLGKVYGKTVVLDLRQEKEIYTTNRFMIYALFPTCNVSVHILPGKQNLNTVFAVGKSVLDRSSQADIGRLMLEYGGGGHKAVGTCQVDNAKAEQIKKEIVERLSKEG